METLPDKDKEALPLKEVINPDKILAETHEQINHSRAKRVKLPTGETFLVRDVLENIARWVKKFVEVGDVAAQYDPGHAALPWAALRFILQVSS